MACQKQQNNDLRSIRENIYFGVVLDKVGGSVTNGSSRALLRGRVFNLGKVCCYSRVSWEINHYALASNHRMASIKRLGLNAIA